MHLLMVAGDRNNSQNTDVSYTYFGTGLGLAFETKAGILILPGQLVNEVIWNLICGNRKFTLDL